MKALKDEQLVNVYLDECSRNKQKNKSKSCTKKNDKVTAVTPPPGIVPRTEAIITDACKEASTSKSSLVTPPPSKTPSASALAMHRKWQLAAETAAGGNKDVRIVVSKPVAKNLIYDLLFDTFSVMNITNICKFFFV